MLDSLVSIVIPVYNAERYLEQSLKSVMEQSYRKLQVLMIDDGSKDASGRICDLYASVDKRFVVKHIENEGVSNARNIGIELANGQYILFLDSDDWLEKDAVYQLVMNAQIYHSDFVIASYNDVENEEKIPQYLCDTDIVLDKMQTENYWLECYRKAGTPWAKLYNLEIIKNYEIKFNREVHYGEDLIFNMRFSSVANRISYSPAIVYNYRLVSIGGAQTKYFPEMSKYRVAVAETALEISKNKSFINNELMEDMMLKLFGSGLGHYGMYIQQDSAMKGIEILVKYFHQKISFWKLKEQFGIIKSVILFLGLGKVYYILLWSKKFINKMRRKDM